MHRNGDIRPPRATPCFIHHNVGSPIVAIRAAGVFMGSVDLPCPGARKAQASGRSCEAGLPDSVAERRLAFPTTGKLFIVGSCYGTLRSAFCLVYCRRERSRLSSSEWAAQLLGGYEDELPLFSSWVVHFIYRGLHIRGSALCLSSID